MNYKLIDFNCERPILKRGEPALPKLDYSQNLPLNLNSSTLAAAYTTIHEQLGKEFFDDIDINWVERNSDDWHNDTLAIISDSIKNLINNYRTSPSDSLLRKIFVRIHLWGGNSGRSVFIRDGGFEENFNLKLYLKAISECKKGDFIKSVKTINEMKFVSTAFSTKHVHFWSDGKAPIYDSIIAAVIFGEPYVKERDYSRYVKVISELAKDQKSTASTIERNLFNWANTPEGLFWRKVRLEK